MTDPRLDAIREGVLGRMERGERLVKAAILAGAALEAGLLIAAIMLMDWGNRLHLLLLIFSVLIYSTLLLGLAAMAGHITRGFGRMFSAMETMMRR